MFHIFGIITLFNYRKYNSINHQDVHVYINYILDVVILKIIIFNNHGNRNTTIKQDYNSIMNIIFYNE